MAGRVEFSVADSSKYDSPRGLVCIGKARSHKLSCGPRSASRWHGCRRSLRKLRRVATRRCTGRLAHWGARASNRSRKRSLSSAPLGHGLSGGLFFAPRTWTRAATNVPVP